MTTIKKQIFNTEMYVNYAVLNAFSYDSSVDGFDFFILKSRIFVSNNKKNIFVNFECRHEKLLEMKRYYLPVRIKYYINNHVGYVFFNSINRKKHKIPIQIFTSGQKY